MPPGWQCRLLLLLLAASLLLLLLRVWQMLGLQSRKTGGCHQARSSTCIILQYSGVGSRTASSWQ